jgi:bla regulator protein BlaR1
VAAIQSAALTPSDSVAVMAPIQATLTLPALPHATLSTQSWAMLCATAASLFFMGWLLARLLRLRRLVRRAGETPIPERVAEAFAHHAVQFHMRRPPRMVLTTSVQSAGVCGVFQSVVLLPESYCELSDEQLGHVFAHEFAHLKRGDLIVSAIQSLLYIVYWFNPALWLAGRRLRDLREICCDAAVSVRLRERTREYGLTLLTAAARHRQARLEPELGLLGLFENPAFLRRRIEYLAHPAWKHRRLRWIAAAAAAALVTLFVMPMAALKAEPATDANPTATSITDMNAKVAQLNLEKATPADIIRLFGEPIFYRNSGPKPITKDNLPNSYIMYYNNGFSVVILNLQVWELHFSQKSDYVFGDGLRVGSSLEKALKVMDAPDLTVDLKGRDLPGTPDGVLFKNGSQGVGYYARQERGVKIYFRNDEVYLLYVTRKSQINPRPADQLKIRTVERTDYPFVDDPAVHGKWLSVDYVKTIEEFRPGEKQWRNSLFLTEMSFLDDGKMVVAFDKSRPPAPAPTWTKGLVLSKNEHIASAYTIKTLDGKKYLFYEWKTYDDVFVAMKPYYYVLTQAGGGN